MNRQVRACMECATFRGVRGAREDRANVARTSLRLRCMQCDFVRQINREEIADAPMSHNAASPDFRRAINAWRRRP